MNVVPMKLAVDAANGDGHRRFAQLLGSAGYPDGYSFGAACRVALEPADLR